MFVVYLLRNLTLCVLLASTLLADDTTKPTSTKSVSVLLITCFLINSLPFGVADVHRVVDWSSPERHYWEWWWNGKLRPALAGGPARVVADCHTAPDCRPAGTHLLPASRVRHLTAKPESGGKPNPNDSPSQAKVAWLSGPVSDQTAEADSSLLQNKGVMIKLLYFNRNGSRAADFW